MSAEPLLLLLRAASAAAAAAVTAADLAASAASPAPSRVQRDGGVHGKAHVREVDGYVGYLREQFIVHAELVSLFLSNSVGVLRLIQSQCQAGAASAARREEHADT